MAAASLLLILLIAAAATLISPAFSQKCNSKPFPNRTFSNCTDLPVLNATLHWAYNATADTFSFAFTVSPVNGIGWIGYGINPSALTMLGTRALVAAAASDGKLTLNTFNISSVSSVTKSAIDYPVLANSTARSGQNNISIFATLQLPAGTTSVNHIWQVGKAAVDGVPQGHAMADENMKSTGVLRLVGGDAVSPAGSPAAGPSGIVSPTGESPAALTPGAGAVSPTGNQAGGGPRIWGAVHGMFVLLFVFNFGF